jgi:hypothetical protein
MNTVITQDTENSFTHHIITIEREGSGMRECFTPVCTCGWRGRGLEAYNNWLWTILEDQKKEHLERVKNSSQYDRTAVKCAEH